MTFLLQRISIGIGNAVHFDLLGLNLRFLTLSRRFRKNAVHPDAGAGGQLFEQFFIKRGQFYYNLNVVNSRTVVQCNKTHLFVSTPGPDPAFDLH